MYIKERFYTRNRDNYVKGINYNNEERLNLDELIEVMESFTKAYEENRNAHIAIREAACFRALYPAMLLDIDEYDRVVGRADIFPLGIGHQYINNQFGFVLRNEWFDAQLASASVSEPQKKKLKAIRNFWKSRTTIGKCEDRREQDEVDYIHGITWDDCPATITKSFRVAGIYVDYEKLLTLGINGLKQEARCLGKSKENTPEYGFYEGVCQSLDVLSDCALWYAERCYVKADEAADTDRKMDLLEMGRILRKIATAKPESFREAVQLVFLYNIVAGPREWGRMDDYLAPYYAGDIRKGLLCEEEAISLLSSGWRLMIVKEQISDDRVIIGGRGRKHVPDADDLAMVIMETSRRVRDIVPQLTLRLYDGIDNRLYDKALDCIGEGCTYPMLYNDDKVIADVKKVFGVPEWEAQEWLPFGCGEYVINHRLINSPNTLMNLSNVLLATLNNGVEICGNTRVAPDYGNITDYKTFEDLFDAYRYTIEDLMDITVRIQGRSYQALREDMTINLVSALYDECLERGKGLVDGGVVHRCGNCEMYGLVTASDSLYAIKKLVYDEKVISPERMLEALKADWVGFEKERAMCLGCEKFGNDQYEVDRMMQRVHELTSFCAQTKSGKNGIKRYTIVNINNKGNTHFGRLTGATPDGRKCGSPLNNGNNPTSGMDKNGMTAFIKSLVKARSDIHAGVVQNMKFSKETFNDMRDTVIKPLLKTYFDDGGAQIMITVVGREDLENAMKEPDKYSNLIVRVGGFSARYIELDRDIQLEILARTMY